MIAIPIVAPTRSEALHDLERAEKIADCTEIRLDLLPQDAWAPLLQKKGKPSIVTLRPARQGGAFQGEERMRIRLLGDVLSLHPDFVDIEWDTPSHGIESLLRRKGTRTGVIFSYHNFSETPDDLDALTNRMASLGGDMLKIVTMAQDLGDNVTMLSLLEKRREKTIGFCMGPFGVPSRILALRAGGCLTFGSLDVGKASAPGQIPAGELREIYRVHQLQKKTKVFGLIGNPIGHSLSPTIHNAAFVAVGFDGVYIPLAVEDLEDLTHDLQCLGVQGFSVTIPHKESTTALLDVLDEDSRQMKAVNTAYRRHGRWLGTNTDVGGAWKALEETGHDLHGKRWTILGAGGVARAVVFGVAKRGRPKSVTVLGRTVKKLERFLKDMQAVNACPVVGTALAGADVERILEETDILVNGTPVGMTPQVDQTPIPCHFLRPGQLVFDTVYNPAETGLLRGAKSQGCQTASGLRMFLHQGAAQFERWTEVPAPLALMEEKAREKLRL